MDDGHAIGIIYMKSAEKSMTSLLEALSKFEFEKDNRMMGDKLPKLIEVGHIVGSYDVVLVLSADDARHISLFVRLYLRGSELGDLISDTQTFVGWSVKKNEEGNDV